MTTKECYEKLLALHDWLTDLKGVNEVSAEQYKADAWRQAIDKATVFTWEARVLLEDEIRGEMGEEEGEEYLDQFDFYTSQEQPVGTIKPASGNHSPDERVFTHLRGV